MEKSKIGETVRTVGAICTISVTILMFITNPYHVPQFILSVVGGAAIIMAVGVLLYDHKPWRWLWRDPRKAALLKWRKANDPKCNLTLPSSRRTPAAKPAEDKAAYLAARERAIESGLKPPAPIGDDDYDSKMFWQWVASRKPDDV